VDLLLLCSHGSDIINCLLDNEFGLNITLKVFTNLAGRVFLCEKAFFCRLSTDTDGSNLISYLST
jgi:hypothetical protein